MWRYVCFERMISVTLVEIAAAAIAAVDDRGGYDFIKIFKHIPGWYY